MDSEFVIMFPAYATEGNVEEIEKFALVLKEQYPNAIVVPLLNTSPDSEFGLARLKSELDSKGCASTIVSGSHPNLGGLVRVLNHGYSHISVMYPELPIVRIDPREHPVDAIDFLVDKAVKDQTMIVADLSFDSNTIVQGSPDHAAHTWVFPGIYSVATGRFDLGVSCAHGFQFFPPGRKCGQIAKLALDILQEAANEAKSSISWGWDGAMILAAAYLQRYCLVSAGVRIIRCPVQAIEIRDRELQKVTGQLRHHVAICLAARAVFGKLEARTKSHDN